MNEAFEKIMERLEELKNHYHKCCLCDYNDGAEASLIEAMSIVRHVKEEYTSTENINCSTDISTNTSTNGWIACSDRLPEKEGVSILISCFNDVEYEFVQEAEFYRDDYGNPIFDCLCFYDKVLAWQQLPQPYKECD